jgi:hypothetical protein
MRHYPPATQDLTIDDVAAASAARFTSGTEKPGLRDSGASPIDASAQDGQLQVGDPELPAAAQKVGASSLDFDGEGPGCGGGRAITSATGASLNPASTRKVIDSTFPSRIPASKIYRLEAPNVPIRAAGGVMSYCRP